MTYLDQTNIPPALHHLIPIAEEWGIDDDYLREEKLNNASESQLRALTSSIDDVSDEDLFGWLEGPESFSAIPSKEYVIFTCLTMAIESAKLKLKRLAKNSRSGDSDSLIPTGDSE